MTDEKKTENLKPSNIKREEKVNENNPWVDDALEHQKFVKPLTDLVNSAEDTPFCIAVDGEWGSGKTFFLKRWHAELTKKDKAVSEQSKVIYFNAWEDDFYADPLTAIIGQLRKEINSPSLEEIYSLCNSIFKKIATGWLRKKLEHWGLVEKDFQTAVGRTVEE